MTLQQILLILRARRRLIAGIFLAFTVAGIVAAFVLPRTYTASVELVIDVKSTNNMLGGALPPQLVASYIRTQMDIISSRQVLERAAARPEVAQDAVLRAQWRAATDEQMPFHEWFARKLDRDIDITPGKDSNMVTLSYACTAPDRCARVVNAVSKAYLDTNLEMQVVPAQHYAEWFDARTKGLRDKLEVAQRKLSEYQRAHGIVATDERLDVETSRLDELSRQLVLAQTERSSSRSRSGHINRADTVPEVVQNPLIAGLKGELARVEAQRADAAAHLGPNHPELVRLNGEVASLKARIALETSRIVGSIGTSDRVNAAHEAEMRAAVQAQKQRVLELKGQRDEIAMLQKDVENAQRTYDLVTGRLAETSLEGQAQQTNVLVLAPASTPTTPSGPRRPLIVSLSAIFALLSGIGLALALEMVRRRVHCEADVMDAIGVPVLSVVPRALIAPPRPLIEGPR